MCSIVWWVTAFVLLTLLATSLRRRGSRRAERVRRRGTSAQPSKPRISAIAPVLAEIGDVEAIAHCTALLECDAFQKAVAHLCTQGFTVHELLTYAKGGNLLIACAAIEALCRQEDVKGTNRSDLEERLFSLLEVDHILLFQFALRALDQLHGEDEPLVWHVLLRSHEWWAHPRVRDALHEFIRSRLKHGEKPTSRDVGGVVPDSKAVLISELLNGFGNAGLRDLSQELAELQTRSIDTEFLDGIGTIWPTVRFASTPREIIVTNDQIRAYVERIKDKLTRDDGRSTLLVGDSGVGKSELVKLLCAQLGEAHWHIFEAGHAELLAGQSWMGMLENRLSELMSKLDPKKQIVWYIPDLYSLTWTGQHNHSRWSAMGYLIPRLEAGEIRIISEIHPSQYDQLLDRHPKCRDVFDVMRIEPMSAGDTMDLAGKWADRLRRMTGQIPISPGLMKEAGELAMQYLRGSPGPGNLLRLLKESAQQIAARDEAPNRRIEHDDLISTLSRLTGLPSRVLDERVSLDVLQLDQQLSSRILGQVEAVDCLVERVAMIKAGVTDATRPLGVFLFGGPTGTGKTEMAKALSAFLFGSSDCMIRFDMSEFQTSETLDRFLGETPSTIETGERTALVDKVRKQPFSVILLDEIEKAHPRIWDLFLQVFDDGRLTPRRGATVDFRHSIIIMTSNIGSAIPTHASLGFGNGEEAYSPEVVKRQIMQSFRREFINRIDRIVVFRPLSRQTMREILEKELREAQKRRGLRRRKWRLKLHEEALQLLLDKGFTPHLGARPLKRAVEQYLLTPLALAIVGDRCPGDGEVVSVRSDGKELLFPFASGGAIQRGEVAIDKTNGEIDRPDGIERKLR